MRTIHELFETRTCMIGIGIVACCLRMGRDLWDVYGRTICVAVDSRWLSCWW